MRTVQFHFFNMAFKKINTIISRDAPLSELLQATASTLWLSNQKNGIWGRLIHCSAVKGPNFPVKALVRRSVHLRDNKEEKNEFIYSYWDNGTKYQVIDEGIRVNVKRSIVSLGV